MAGFCLPKFAADALKGKLVSGEFTPEQLGGMTSAERRQAFSFLGEANAKQVNALFESKLLLKNQQAGMIRWAQQVLRLKPDTLRDTISKVERMTEVMSPQQLDMFLEDLVGKKLGIDVTVEEAGKLVDLAKRVEDSKTKIPEGSPLRSQERLEYGMNLAVFKDYVEQLKLGNDSPFLKKYLESPSQVIYDVAGSAKSILASLDNSFFGRQGIKMLFTNPDIWAKNFSKSWGDIGRSLMGEDATLAIKADVYSRPMALDGTYQRGKVAVGIATEEAFPSSLPTRIPVIGRLFAASEQAYNGAALRMRADLADRLYAQAQRNGVDITDTAQAQSIGSLVNAMTGRGNLGKIDVFAKETNVLLFSAKFLKSNIDTLTAHQFQGNITPYARKLAAVNTAKIIGGIASTLYIAEQLWPGSVEWDPRSSDFGKIKIGSVRYDISGGMGSLIVLAGRLATGESKSTKTGKITELNTDKFGALTRGDVLIRFAEGKLSPAARLFVDNIMTGKNFDGDKPTLQSNIEAIAKPLPIQTYEDLKGAKNADVFWAMLWSQLGVGVSAY